MRDAREAVSSVLLLCLLAGGVSSSLAAEDLGGIGASVVQVGVKRANGRLAVGSAVVIAPGVLVTACHGTRGAQSVVLMHGAEQMPVTVQSEDLEHDLCLLSAPAIRGPVAKLGGRKLAVGEEVLAVGFSGGLRMSASVGQVKALYAHDGARVIRTSAAFSTGASGGGLFDREGRLVGILSFKSTAGDDHHYAMPVEWLASTWDRGSVEKTDRAFWEVEENLQPVFLRAAWLEGTGAWSELADLAEQWTESAPSDIEAWIALARASLTMQDWRLAELALRCAASLDAGHVEVRALGAAGAKQAVQDESASRLR